MNFYFSILLEELSSIQRDADDIEDVDGVEAVDESLPFSTFLEEWSSIQRDADDIEDVIFLLYSVFT